MKKSSGPVPDFSLAEAARKQFMDEQATLSLPDFSDTEQTFKHLDDDELRRVRWLFRLMGHESLTKIMSSLGVGAVNLGLPGAAWMVRNTIYKQFVGGTSLVSALPSIEALAKSQVTSILDYGAEAKNSEADYNHFMKEVLRAIEFSAEAPAAVAAVVKVTGLAPDDMLARLNPTQIDFDADDPELQATLRRLDAICGQAEKLSVQVYIDAEESWLQNTIDQLADRMMARYNTKRVTVLNTFQLYRHDRLAFLQASHERAVKGGYRLGAKLVRGAYMIKENARAAAMGYATPIQATLAATHRDYNAAVRFCADNILTVGCCIATHNEASTRLMTELMAEKEIPRNHSNIQFAQLLGMSDNLTFNLAAGGYNVSKYMVYGPVQEVLPYLVRRAQENSSVTGEMGRELRMIETELARRQG
ncbi:MAG: proline dehydrogenase family protein [Bacteroidota bacterium]